MQKLVAFAFVLSSFFAAGCGSFRVLSEARTGGTVALEGAHESAREKAEDYMRAQCPRGYEIIEEGEAAAAAGDDREWRIAYRCSDAKGKKIALVAL